MFIFGDILQISAYPNFIGIYLKFVYEKIILHICYCLLLKSKLFLTNIEIT